MGKRSAGRIPSPPPFDGDVEALADFVVANILPAPGIAERFHAALCGYCDSPDPLFVIRAPGAARTMRGGVVVTADGCKVRFSDNAPAWQVHHTLFCERLAEVAQFPAFVERLPTHFFEVTKRVPDSISSAGWYVAHVLPVGDRRPLREWRRPDVTRRFVRNIHPCNLFYVPKEHGRALGENPEVIALFAARLRLLYTSVWEGFVRLAGDGTEPAPPVAAATRVAVRTARRPAGVPTENQAFPSRRALSPTRMDMEPEPAETLPARYAHSRLCFKRDVIEPLKDFEAFEVATPRGTFRMTKRQFLDNFPNVVASASYRDRGVYHYKQVPARALKYLVHAE